MMPGINPRDMQKALKKMGVKQEEIEATEVIIKGPKEFLVKNPQVIKINMMGQESLQITGEIIEREGITEEDIKTVMEQANVDEQTAKHTLNQTNGDLAQAILKLKEDE